MIATHDIVIESDRRGRLRFTREQRAAMLEAYDASGLSGPKFAQHKRSIPGCRKLVAAGA